MANENQFNSTGGTTHTFNCGIGMIVITEPGSSQNIVQELTHLGETVYELGCEKSFEKLAESNSREHYELEKLSKKVKVAVLISKKWHKLTSTN